MLLKSQKIKFLEYLGQKFGVIIKRLFKRLKKVFTPVVWRNTLDVIQNKKIIAYWWKGANNKNWGDKINPFLIEALSNKKVIHVDDVFNFRFLKVYVGIGSIIHKLRFKNVHIWGTGLINNELDRNLKLGKIHAVRGPLTQTILTKKGYTCPEVYGDPALLLPSIHFPKVKKTNELGIIPHFVDRDNNHIDRLKMEGGLILDIFSPELELIEKVLSCKRIVSSSLHGLILADAYGIPTKWIKFSELHGKHFKFKDYYMSIGVENEKPHLINKNSTIAILKSLCRKRTMDVDLNKLLRSCPFYQNNL